MKTNKKAYINNFESISCAGNDSEELFKSICEKKETITLDNSFIKEKTIAIGKINSVESFTDLLINKCKKVLEKSNLDSFENTLLVIGSSVGGMNNTEKIFFKDKNYKNINPIYHPVDAIATILKENFTFYDDISFSTACTSSANALGYAKEVISKNIYNNVLVVGIDSLSYTTVCGFSALSVLSSKPCTPFDKNREGMNVSEAIAILLLQDETTANSIELCGVGYSSDAHHMTQPHPEGLGAKSAMQTAITDAKISPYDIGYINAHGTGTQANDLSELTAIKSLFENDTPSVSSTKSITGHTLGAAGALEAIISCMILQKQLVPPNKGLENIEIENINYSFKLEQKEVSYVLSNSFAFGGNNTSLIFGLVK
ncbi:beta-ketoacyl-[acyl-carrier-protein] synthase family protein [Arcobacter sp.]|uniref:beta-ketoacyl-[acyl-carrier-protein] synthase family protein n=1 Tax=Arcobacter sp. TaxID=1872629 RepID=UPI003D0CE9E2